MLDLTKLQIHSKVNIHNSIWQFQHGFQLVLKEKQVSNLFLKSFLHPFTCIYQVYLQLQFQGLVIKVFLFSLYLFSFFHESKLKLILQVLHQPLSNQLQFLMYLSLFNLILLIFIFHQIEKVRLFANIQLLLSFYDIYSQKKFLLTFF